MHIKTLLLSLILCILTLFVSCNPSKEINSKTTKKESTTQTTKTKTQSKDEIDIKWRNYYNDRIAEDKEYTYYIDAYGVNKISKTDNKVEKLTNKDFSKTNLGFFLAKHNDYIYFVTSQGLCRIGTDGQNYYKFKDIPTSNSLVKCVNDKLYIHFSFITHNHSRDDIIYCYDIKNDPKEPKLITKDAVNFPSPDGKMYSLKTIGEGPDKILHSYNIDGKNKKEILCYVNEVLVYENNFYYSDMYGKIFKCDKNGKNQKEIYDLKNSMLNFISYDGEWIYIFIEGNLEDKYVRLNTNTNKLESLKKFDKYELRVFNVTDKHIYWWNAGRTKQISNDCTGDAIFVK